MTHPFTSTPPIREDPPEQQQLKNEIENHLTGKDTEPTEIIYFKLYKSPIPVVEQAIETAAVMLGSDALCIGG